MSKKIISTPNAAPAIGPYSQGVVVTGNLLFTAGQGPLDPATGKIVPGGIEEQTVRTLENLKAILEAAGTKFENVVKANVYLSDLNNFAAMNAVYAKYLAPAGTPPPARTTIQAARLPGDILVEIELIAEVE
jgi:2-iminobutanoate/2-iminopropanoate deaminase